MRLTHYDECRKRWQINNDYGVVMIDGLNYAVGEAIDKLAAFEDAEEQGLLVRIPCKVGDAIYVTKDQLKFPAVKTVKYISWSDGAGCDGKVKISALNNRTGIVTHYSAEDFGKTVFLTREEAEAALEGEKNE